MLRRAFSVVCFLVGAGSAAASVVTYMDSQALVRSSDVIVRGEVEAVTSGRDPDTSRIYTYATIRIEENLKGARGEDRITLRHLGGRVGGLGLLIHGMPAYRPGEEVVVFASRGRSGALTTSGLFQGKYRIERANGREYVRRASPGSAAVVDAAGARREPSVESLDGFLDRIRRSIRGEAVEPPAAEPEPSPSFSFIPEEFTFLGNTRWFEPDTETPILLRMNSSLAPSVPGGVASALTAAVAAWNDVDSSTLIAENAGSTTSACFGDAPDGVNSISHGDMCDEMSSFNAGSCSGVLAIGGPWFDDTETIDVNGVTFVQSVEGEVIFNADTDCFFTLPGNYEEVLAHELGHVFGLGHSCTSQLGCGSNPELDDALMRAFAHGDGRGAAIGDDDRDGIRFIYPTDAFVDAIVNQPLFGPGDTHVLRVDTNGTEMVDAYLAVVLPSGNFLTLEPDLSFSPLNTAVPFVTNFPLLFLDEELVISYTFDGTEAPGEYAWIVVLVPPGADPVDSGNWIWSDTELFTVQP